ncbi:Glyoxalase superfamily enzyme, possibly 3-demethylubiquinone-9 3-methyltransferase [Paraoerskovia marina]|uniref:Glyoxalase superfamily enzyme, possibly 3-demethylubiquinone-9 3-methyltransferase n=1 Tax=Paraoerskovia marina TaxID=545619 RepID=A0A1H1M9A9_9CELL|nr:VOC family protein [Paraoerskovia marina]SDR83383.1 Glyoxalase superfamily enzyme, possibly 3-demethylubiquinone-9 3-methyltransferase [Paraoerskovia marina]
MQTITPSLWFDDDFEEAAAFYASIFPDSELGPVVRNPDGSVLAGDFTLMGRPFNGINGGSHFRFTEAVSFLLPCDSQEEADHYWEVLTADGGQESQCGWLKDRFGLSWQVVPTELYSLMSGPDPAANARVTEAMMQMNRIDLTVLRAARDGGDTP